MLGGLLFPGVMLRLNVRQSVCWGGQLLFPGVMLRLNVIS